MSAVYSGKKVLFSPVLKDGKLRWEVDLRGINLGGKATLHSLQRGGLRIVIKVAGHTVMTEYVPAAFMVFDMHEPVLLDKVYSTYYKLKNFVMEFPVKGLEVQL